MNGTYECDLIWKKVFMQNAIKLRVWKENCPGIRVSTKSNDGHPNMRKEREGWHHRSRERNPEGKGT